MVVSGAAFVQLVVEPANFRTVRSRCLPVM